MYLVVNALGARVMVYGALFRAAWGWQRRPPTSRARTSTLVLTGVLDVRLARREGNAD